MSEPIREIIPEKEVELNVVAPQEEKMPMVWHAALVKGLLWLEMILHLAQAAMILLGKIYRVTSAQAAVYAGMPAMRFIDYILAAALIAAAVLMFLARNKLAKRMCAGIKLLNAAYILLPAAWIFYGAARFLVAGLSPFSIPVIGQCIAWAALLLVNRSYYSKRAGMFK